MPVMVLYKDKSISNEAIDDLASELATLTAEQLDAKIEIRAVEPVYAFNANELHLEMRFRDFGEWTDKLLATYHKAVMEKIGLVLGKHKTSCQYSFYILPSSPPRSMWAQANSKV